MEALGLTPDRPIPDFGASGQFSAATVRSLVPASDVDLHFGAVNGWIHWSEVPGSAHYASPSRSVLTLRVWYLFWSAWLRQAGRPSGTPLDDLERLWADFGYPDSTRHLSHDMPWRSGSDEDLLAGWDVWIARERLDLEEALRVNNE
jgi:hypothetical protein